MLIKQCPVPFPKCHVLSRFLWFVNHIIYFRALKSCVCGDIDHLISSLPFSMAFLVIRQTLITDSLPPTSKMQCPNRMCHSHATLLHNISCPAPWSTADTITWDTAVQNCLSQFKFFWMSGHMTKPMQSQHGPSWHTFVLSTLQWEQGKWFLGCLNCVPSQHVLCHTFVLYAAKPCTCCWFSPSRVSRHFILQSFSCRNKNYWCKLTWRHGFKIEEAKKSDDACESWLCSWCIHWPIGNIKWLPMLINFTTVFIDSQVVFEYMFVCIYLFQVDWGMNPPSCYYNQSSNRRVFSSHLLSAIQYILFEVFKIAFHQLLLW